MLSLVVASLLIQATSTYGDFISVDNGGSWGDWGEVQRCPPMTSARGFSLKMEKPLGSDGDDTALNGIQLYCTRCTSRDVVGTITSTVGGWGDWTPISWCSRGNYIKFALKVEKPQGDGDDTAVNSIKMGCSNNSTEEGNNGYWGDFGRWSGICPLGICGIRTRVERAQGRGDDTALNDVQLECC
ncbi:vitelline membrane outer layer protein 1 homolog [Phyllobates terribilis]|uniref:vitelline membrane outer layer protein 1 homolog n=1 Tax=Phyllobates terribilis TaxID=111132 RepID=UPI003CCB0350